MSYRLKNVVIFLKNTICFLLSRPFDCTCLGNNRILTNEITLGSFNHCKGPYYSPYMQSSFQDEYFRSDFGGSFEGTNSVQMSVQVCISGILKFNYWKAPVITTRTQNFI